MIKHDALRGELVEVRGLHVGIAIATEGVGAEVVGEEDDEVGAGGAGLDAEGEEAGQSDAEESEGETAHEGGETPEAARTLRARVKARRWL